MTGDRFPYDGNIFHPHSSWLCHKLFKSPVGILRAAYCPSPHRPERHCQEYLDLSTSKSLSAGTQFRYSNGLDSRNIRLLLIKLGKGEDIIHVDLCTYPLDCAPTYVALSYTWGDPKHTSVILCQGRTLRVTQNLKDALWQLRESHDTFTKRGYARRKDNKSPYFWIDAVCINQNDDVEKNHQVKLMREIYSDIVIGEK